MSEAVDTQPAIGLFERYLTLWVAACIVLGTAVGHWLPGPFATLGAMQLARVNLPMALLIWLMIVPMLLKVDLGAMRQVGRHWKGMGVTLFVNWAVKPFSMAVLAWLFLRHVFAGHLPPGEVDSYVAGLILLAAAPCTAMVFVWSHLTRGDPNYTLVQVSVNDVIMIFAFAPIAGLLLGMSDVHVPWETLVLSVALYVLLPLLAGMFTRWRLQRGGGTSAVDGFVASLKPWSVLGLLATVVLLFGFQAEVVVAQPQRIALIAIPLLLQTYGIFLLAYAAARVLRLPHDVAAPACLIGTSNFFELAVAVAISLFGLQSGAALATVVGVLVEVPVMLSLVGLANRTRHWFAYG